MRKKPAMEIAKPGKVLLIMLDHIGDVLWKTPAIATLRKNLPQAKLYALLTPYTREILEGNPAIDSLFVYNPKEHRSLAGKKQCLLELKKEKMDLAICLDPRDEAALLALLCGAAFRVGFYYLDKPLSRLKGFFTLSHRFVHPAEAARKDGRFYHEVEANLKLMELLGFGQEPVKEITLPLNGEDLDFAGQSLKDRRLRVALHLEPKWFSDHWTEEFFLSFLRELEDAFPGEDFLITYGPEGEKLAKDLLTGLPEKFLVMGGLSVKKWAALLSRARVLVCRDGGSAHVAAAVKTRVVSIFESKKYSQHKRWTPWGTEYLALFREEKKNKDLNQEQKHKEEIIKAIKGLL